MDELTQDLWSKRQLPPSWLDDRTPHEILYLFCRGDVRGDEPEFDRLAEIHRMNHVRRAPKGLAPVVPDWLMPEVPR